MKIFINRKPVEGPWGGGNNFVKAFHEYLPMHGHTVVDNLFEEDIDILFVMNPEYDEMGISINEIIHYKKNINTNAKIVQRINDCDARKGTEWVDDMLKNCSLFIDKTVFVSEWVKEYHLKNEWHCISNHVLVNGVDKMYKPSEKIKNGKLNIVTHHWSDNELKGFDVYDKIDELCGTRDDITFTYIGRERGTFKNTVVIPPIFGKDLADQLSKYDIYISASRFDPGPNHILESLACEIPTYAFKDGGGACEFVGEDFIYDSFESLCVILSKETYNKNDKTIIASWEECMRKLNEDILLKC